MLKICPECGTEFSFDYRECIICRADLSTAKIYHHPSAKGSVTVKDTQNKNMAGAGDKKAELTEEKLRQIEKYFPRQRGNVKVDNFSFVSAIIYISEKDCRWRDLPAEFGKWSTVYKRFRRWSENGIMEVVFDALAEEKLISQRARRRLERESVLSRADLI